MVDYPNSNKAKKVFLCLFVGGGGGQQVPKGLEGDAEADAGAKFERRRERERTRAKSGKRKNVKDRDWILKKKEVRSCIISVPAVNAWPTAIPQKGKRRCSKRFKVYWPKTASRVLATPPLHEHKTTLIVYMAHASLAKNSL